MDAQEVNIIAEIGQAHDGSLGILHSMIDEAKKAGADAAKFQMHISEAESSPQEPFRVNFSYEDETRFDYWKRMEFTEDQWRGIKIHCQEAGLEFLVSPFSLAAVDQLERLGVKRYKIGSGEVSNLLLLNKIADTGKPVILSSGMSSFAELDKAINVLMEKNISCSVLQCTTQYPTSPQNIGLNLIPELRDKYQLPVGFSDHSGTIFPGLAAVTLGATLLEVHVTFDKGMFGPDTKSSLTFSELGSLVQGVRFLETALKHPVNKDDLRSYKELKGIFEKTLAVNKDLPQNHEIRLEDLETKKPAKQGIPAQDYEKVIGKRLNRDLSKYSFLREVDLND